jgi:hypothetical protein
MGPGKRSSEHASIHKLDQSAFECQVVAEKVLKDVLARGTRWFSGVLGAQGLDPDRHV